MSENEPWETTTQYGSVDLTLHPVLRECYRVACLIERCGASEDLTRASSAAFDLCEKVQNVILELCGEGIADQKTCERYKLALQRANGFLIMHNLEPVKLEYSPDSAGEKP